MALLVGKGINSKNFHGTFQNSLATISETLININFNAVFNNL